MTQRVLPTLNISLLDDDGATRSAWPERVLQFGTGAFLRGFAEYFVEQANRAGRLNGRVVMVGSTGSGRAGRLNEQDGLYTLCVRGRAEGKVIDHAQVITSVSRALASQDRWADVLACARNPELALIISNTTEVGITLDEGDQMDLDPPRSFPGKLTAVLYERAQTFDFDPAKGLIILPCELVETNGEVLRQMVHSLAERWHLGAAFAQWLGEANQFCNTLVDRIVPGTPDADEKDMLYEQLGYRDDLLTVAEPYRLWAIEGDATLKESLPLAGTDPGIVITEDITPYRERKVRILNGTHTVMVSVALLCGLKTVREAVEDTHVGAFIRQVMLEEIVPSLDMAPDMAHTFAEEVLERFANPFIQHALLDITFQQTTKMRVRVVPSLLGYVAKKKEVPSAIALGFACFFLFQHPEMGPSDKERPQDDRAADWRKRWADVDPSDAMQVRSFVEMVCADEFLWGRRLDTLPGFTEVVTDYLVQVAQDGVAKVLGAHFQTAE